MAYTFDHLTACGTFDRLHKGHRYFLKQAFKLAKTVLVGITSDAFVLSKPNQGLIEPYQQRRARVIKFLKSHHLFKRASIFKLDDLFGPSIRKDSPLQAVLVTKKTKKGAELVNKKRQALGLAPLKIVTINLIKDSNGQPLSSKNVRKKLLSTTLFLPNRLRPLFKKPFGRLLSGSEEDLSVALEKAKKLIIKEKPKVLICVGDVVTKLLNEDKIEMNLAVVDFRIRRQKVIKNLKALGFTKNKADYTVLNKPGRVSFKLAHAIEQALREPSKNKIIKVLGEEDLAVLPCLVFAPLGTLILYGQPGQGIVAVDVNKNTRKRALTLANKFENR